MAKLAPQYLPRKNLRSAPEIKDWLNKYGPALTNGGLEFLGNHINSDPEEKFYSTDALKLIAVRMSTYGAVATSMTHGLLAQIAHTQNPNNFVDFAFLPERSDYEKFMERDIPIIFGSTTKRHLSEFDVVLLSMPVTTERFNWPGCLVRSGVPLFKNQRMEDENSPLIIYGGVNSFCSEDLHGYFDDENYGLVDCVIIGDGERALHHFLDVYSAGKQAGLTKKEILRSCHGRIKGFYEPDLYEFEYGVNPEYHDTYEVITSIKPKVDYCEFPVKREFVMDLDNYPVLTNNIIHWNGASDKGDIEVARGCGARCSFCKESWANKPYRERSLDKIKEESDKARRNQGTRQLNFWSFNWSDHTDTYGIIEYGIGKMETLNLLSQRADVLASDPFQMEIMKASGDLRITTALEGISERMRRFLHKNLTHDEIITAIQALAEKGFHEIKLFMIFTGCETKEDADEFIGLLEKIEEFRRGVGRTMMVRVSFMTLLSVACTPMQFARAYKWFKQDTQVLQPVLEKCRELYIGFRTGIKLAEYPLVQILEQGDRRLTRAMIKMSIDTNFIYYSLARKGFYEIMESYLNEDGLCFDQYFHEKPLSYIFPWDHVDMGPTKEGLFRSFQDAVQNIQGGYCLKTRAQDFGCSGCKACQPSYMKDFLINRDIPNPETPAAILIRERRSFEPSFYIRFLLDMPEPTYRVIPVRAVNQVLTRALVLSDDKIDHSFLRVFNNSRSIASKGDEKYWAHGNFIVDAGFNLADPREIQAIINRNLSTINRELKIFKLLDSKIIKKGSYTTLKDDIGYCFFEIQYRGKLEKLKVNIEDLRSSKAIEIKKRISAGKGIYRTQKNVIATDKILMTDYQYMPDGSILLRAVIKSDINPYSFCSYLTGVRLNQLCIYPIKVLRYLDISELDRDDREAGKVSLSWVDIMNGLTEEDLASRSQFKDVFTGEYISEEFLTHGKKQALIHR